MRGLQRDVKKVKKSAWKKGEKIGIEKGRADAMREMARTLKSLGKMSIVEISVATGLSAEEIEKM